MSNEPGNSLLSSVWRGALVLCGIAVLLWIAVKLIEQIWVWLVVIAAVLVVLAAGVIVLRWWLHRRRW